MIALFDRSKLPDSVSLAGVQSQMRETIHFLQILWTVVIFYPIHMVDMFSSLNHVVRMCAVPSEVISLDSPRAAAPYGSGIQSSFFAAYCASNIVPRVGLTALPSWAIGAARAWSSFVPWFPAFQLMSENILGSLPPLCYRGDLHTTATFAGHTRQFQNSCTASLPVSFPHSRTSKCHVTGYFIRSEVLTP